MATPSQATLQTVSVQVVQNQMPSPTDTPLLCLRVFGDGSNKPSTDRRRFSFRSHPDLVDIEPKRPINPFTGELIELESPDTNASNREYAHPETQVVGKSSAPPHNPLSCTRTAGGTAPGTISCTPARLKSESLKPIRDSLNSLLHETSPAEARRLRKIIDDLNAEIPPDVSNGRTADTSSSLAPTMGSVTAVNATKAYLRHVRMFQSSNTPGETVWYESSDNAPLVHPDAAINPNLWISTVEGRWNGIAAEYDQKYLPDRIIMGVPHPKFNDRLLKLRANGEPSWVTRQTLATLKSRKKGETAPAKG